MARAPVFKGMDARASKSGEDSVNMEKPLVKIVAGVNEGAAATKARSNFCFKQIQVKGKSDGHGGR